MKNGENNLEPRKYSNRQFIKHLINIPLSLLLGLITIVVFIEITTINSDSYGKGMSYIIFVPVALVCVLIIYVLLPIIVSYSFHKNIKPLLNVLLSGILGALLPMAAVYLFMFTFLIILTLSE